MAHPYHHAISSEKKFGGVAAQYIPIHNWFDSTKAHLANFRHRAIRHHREAIALLEAELKTMTITTSDGKIIPLSLIGHQHIEEDCERVVCLDEWLINYRFPRLKESGSTLRPEKKWGGTYDDYLPLHYFFEGYHPLQLHHSHGIFQVEAIFGMTITNSVGRIVPVRVLCEEYLLNRYKIIPTPFDWVKGIIYQPWMLHTQKIENSFTTH